MIWSSTALVVIAAAVGLSVIVLLVILAIRVSQMERVLRMATRLAVDAKQAATDTVASATAAANAFSFDPADTGMTGTNPYAYQEPEIVLEHTEVDPDLERNQRAMAHRRPPMRSTRKQKRQEAAAANALQKRQKQQQQQKSAVRRGARASMMAKRPRGRAPARRVRPPPLRPSPIVTSLEAQRLSAVGAGKDRVGAAGMAASLPRRRTPPAVEAPPPPSIPSPEIQARYGAGSETGPPPSDAM